MMLRLLQIHGKQFLFALASVMYLTICANSILAQAPSGRVYTLTEILEIAEQRNPSVAVFRANLESARGALRSARAFPNPDVDFDYGKGLALEEPGSDYQREYGITVGQLIEWPGKRSNRIKTADAEVQAAQQDLEDFRLELKAEIKEAFYNVVLSKQILDVSKRNVETAQALLRSAKLRVESGESPELELIKAQVELLKVTKDLRRAESRVLIFRSALNTLLGRSLEEGFEISGEFSDSDRKFDLASLIENAVQQHPAILRAQKALQAAGYAVSTEKQARIPDIGVGVSFEEEVDKKGYGLGVSIGIPLLYQRQGEIASAQAARSRAEAELNQAKAELVNLINQEYQNYQIASGQLDVFKEGLIKQAEEALRIAQLSYEQGESDLLELLDAQRTYRATFIEYYQAQFELQAALARLERVTGGLL